MKKKWLAWMLAAGMMLPVHAGAAQAPCGYPAAEDFPKTMTRGAFLEHLALCAEEDLTQDTWIPMEEYFADGETASAAVKWTFAKWILNGSGAGDKAALRLDDPITRQEAAAFLGRYLDYRYTELPDGCGTGAPQMDNVAAWARDGVMKCWLYRVIDTGYAPDFRPEGLVSGAEAAQWIAAANAVQASAITAPEQPAFADNLVRKLETKDNWAVSPYSIRMCLAMLANGAKGETQRELLEALDIADLAAFNAQTRDLLRTYDGYARIMSLETANSLWLNQSWFDGQGEFLPGFARKMEENYRAAAEEVTNRDAVERVNAWVNEKTHGKIPSVLTEDNRKFVTALVNAVYFKAVWENEFPARRTEKAEFTNADGTKSKVDMMHQTDSFGYYATPGAQALKMDYCKYAVDNAEGDNWEFFRDADFSMYIIKADKGLDVQHFLDSADFSKGSGEIRVAVPKFKVEYGAALDDALRALGVQTAYDAEQADLTAMLDPTGLPDKQHFLDTVLHKTYIAVDEKGTEAAAVTAAMDGAGSAMPERPALVREFTADEPFYFAIRDNTAGELLFVGRYEKAA